MYINISTDLVVMTPNTVYKPMWVNTSPLLKDHAGSPYDPINQAASAMVGPGHWDKYPIFRVQVAKNSLSNLFVRIWLFNTPDSSPIDVPCAAFLVGHNYDMHINKYTIVDGSGTEQSGQFTNFTLIGHYCNAFPIDL